ncbi:glycoside hydrolase family 3 C-terminal domain-containing protein [Pedobacter glucosidilyticus]|uniref:glycoside hydrolase family 3 C-terminal domain-containing protein n=1 Tax=Pedobacter glucosidilyticus TaxID=1122941 RepID=UPI00040484FA|nr:glycoside hydrolase family 3 C-terminal domain-containing protein [Pedobacter glucosidilyticus]
MINKCTCFLVLISFFNTASAQEKNIERKIDSLISLMTLEEKVGMIHANSSFTSGGVPRLGIPELITSDGPHGVRVEHGRDWDYTNDNVDDAGTYLPTGIGLAATWNTKLGYEFGKVLANEAKARGKDVILGPGVNIIRTPLNGRNFEYLSEDPYLNARMAVGYIKGVQDQGISASVKHYIANNQEKDRNTIDVNMSDRALHEIYLPGFKAAVLEGDVNTVMGSYNKFRGQWAAQNHYLINQILKGQWGFKGVLISDWGAIHNTMEALYNGTDIEFGSEFTLPKGAGYNDFFLADTVISLVKDKKVPVAIIDEKVRRILRIMYKTNMLENAKRTPGAFATPAHFKKALEIAEESIVLLKNENNILPLNAKKIKTIAVIGLNAKRPHAFGGGSSHVKAKYEITPLQGIERYFAGKAKVVYADGYEIKRGAVANPQLINEAVKLATNADQVIFVGGWHHGYDYTKWEEKAYDTEGEDKPDMKLPSGQDELIKALLKVKPNTINIMMGGGPVDMSAWIKDAAVVVQAWYPGMEGGTALANIIFGKTNPSGKLPVTFPVKLEDSPAHKLAAYPGTNGVTYYSEDIFVGYRYFDTYQVKPQFAFGHGLSYTQFKYDDIKVLVQPDSTIKITFNLKNTGKKAGYETAQLYVAALNPTIARPVKELKGFEKVWLNPGEAKQVSVSCSLEAFKYFDEKKSNWTLTKGNYQILIGASSTDIKLSGDLKF